MISTKQIKYAIALGKTLHFKRAAENCAVTQSALSTALAELEKQLGFLIFERDNKKVLITPAGQQFLEKAEEIKLQIDDLYQLAQTNRELLTSPLTVGLIPTIAPYLLPKILPSIKQEYPNLPLTLLEEQSHVLVEKVRSGEIDTAIIALPYPIETLISFDFWEEDFYWVTHKDDPLADLQQIDHTDIEEQTLMLLHDGHCLKDQALQICNLKNEPSESIQFQATNLHTLVQMVQGKMGNTIIPEIALDQLINDVTKLKAIPLKEPGPHRKLAFIVRANYPGVRNIEALIKVIKRDLKSMLTHS